MFALVVLAVIVLIGPLTARSGTDSRLPNDGWNGWPTSRRKGAPIPYLADVTAEPAKLDASAPSHPGSVSWGDSSWGGVSSW
jgi:hypothetical protein